MDQYEAIRLTRDRLSHSYGTSQFPVRVKRSTRALVKESEARDAR